eukprot:scaffold226603_cov18-Tisochrysis_lutea.AAC.2
MARARITCGWSLDLGEGSPSHSTKLKSLFHPQLVPSWRNSSVAPGVSPDLTICELVCFLDPASQTPILLLYTNASLLVSQAGELLKAPSGWNWTCFMPPYPPAHKACS